MTLDQLDALPVTERLARYAEDARERGTCRECGRPLVECSDRDKDWFPQRTICYPTMNAQAANQSYAELHEKAPYHDGTHRSWSEKRTKAHPFRYDDGVKVWVHDVDLSPHDHFLGGVYDCEVCTPPTTD